LTDATEAAKNPTPAQAEARRKRLREISDKYEDVSQELQDDLSRLAKLHNLRNPTPEENQELAALRKKMDAGKPRFADIMAQVMCVQLGLLDEAPAKAKARMEKLRAYCNEELSLQIEMAFLAEILQPYRPNQLAGSVWLYQRQAGGKK
jgi:hypothetical protein